MDSPSKKFTRVSGVDSISLMRSGFIKIGVPLSFFSSIMKIVSHTAKKMRRYPKHVPILLDVAKGLYASVQSAPVQIPIMERS